MPLHISTFTYELAHKSLVIILLWHVDLAPYEKGKYNKNCKYKDGICFPCPQII